MVIMVIPAYNEEKNIGRLLRQLNAIKEKIHYRHILVIDDGSNDRTVQKAQSFADKLPVTTISLEKNCGPGAAFDLGLREAVRLAKKHDVVCTMEADTTSDITIFPTMLSQLASGADVVLASCYSPKGGEVIGTSVDRRILSFGANLLLRAFFPIPGVYTYSSFYRAYRPAVLHAVLDAKKRLFTEKGFVCMVELLIMLARLPIQIREVPMILRGSQRVGASKMKIIKTVTTYFRVMIRYGLIDYIPIQANRY